MIVTEEKLNFLTIRTGHNILYTCSEKLQDMWTKVYKKLRPVYFYRTDEILQKRRPVLHVAGNFTCLRIQ